MLEVRKVSGSPEIQDRTDETWNSSTDTTGSLNVLRGGFWLTVGYHQTQSGNIDAHGNHVTCKYGVHWLAAPRIAPELDVELVQLLGNLARWYAAAELRRFLLHRPERCTLYACKKLHCARDVVERHDNRASELPETVEVSDRRPIWIDIIVTPAAKLTLRMD